MARPPAVPRPAIGVARGRAAASPCLSVGLAAALLGQVDLGSVGRATLPLQGAAMPRSPASSSASAAGVSVYGTGQCSLFILPPVLSLLPVSA